MEAQTLTWILFALSNLIIQQGRFGQTPRVNGNAKLLWSVSKRYVKPMRLPGDKNSVLFLGNQNRLSQRSFYRSDPAGFKAQEIWESSGDMPIRLVVMRRIFRHRAGAWKNQRNILHKFLQWALPYRVMWTTGSEWVSNGDQITAPIPQPMGYSMIKSQPPTPIFQERGKLLCLIVGLYLLWSGYFRANFDQSLWAWYFRRCCENRGKHRLWRQVWWRSRSEDLWSYFWNMVSWREWTKAQNVCFRRTSLREKSFFTEKWWAF